VRHRRKRQAVISAKTVKSDPREFEQPALDAIHNWVFKPATKDGNQ